MKHLNQEAVLTGKFEPISISDLRKQPGDVLAQVELGKVFVITRQGKPAAVLSRVPGVELVLEIKPDGSQSYKL